MAVCQNQQLVFPRPTSTNIYIQEPLNSRNISVFNYNSSSRMFPVINLIKIRQHDKLAGCWPVAGWLLAGCQLTAAPLADIALRIPRSNKNLTYTRWTLYGRHRARWMAIATRRVYVISAWCADLWIVFMWF